MTKRAARPRRTGAKALEGSDDARRLAALLLQALSGVLGAGEAAEAMGVALPRYYQLETRALQAMIEALEPLPRGRRPDLEKELAQANEKVDRLTRELRRYQALNRASQRALGLASTDGAEERQSSQSKTKTVRRRRKRSRGERVAEALQQVKPESGTGGDGATGEVP